MCRNFYWAAQVFSARELIGKHQREQIFRGHPLQLRCNLPAAAPTRNRQRARRVPAPANIEHGRVEQRLRQHIADAF